MSKSDARHKKSSKWYKDDSATLSELKEEEKKHRKKQPFRRILLGFLSDLMTSPRLIGS